MLEAYCATSAQKNSTFLQALLKIKWLPFFCGFLNSVHTSFIK